MGRAWAMYPNPDEQVSLMSTETNLLVNAFRANGDEKKFVRLLVAAVYDLLYAAKMPEKAAELLQMATNYVSKEEVASKVALVATFRVREDNQPEEDQLEFLKFCGEVLGMEITFLRPKPSIIDLFNAVMRFEETRVANATGDTPDDFKYAQAETVKQFVSGISDFVYVTFQGKMYGPVRGTHGSIPPDPTKSTVLIQDKNGKYWKLWYFDEDIAIAT